MIIFLPSLKKNLGSFFFIINYRIFLSSFFVLIFISLFFPLFLFFLYYSFVHIFPRLPTFPSLFSPFSIYLSSSYSSIYFYLSLTFPFSLLSTPRKIKREGKKREKKERGKKREGKEKTKIPLSHHLQSLG